MGSKYNTWNLSQVVQSTILLLDFVNNGNVKNIASVSKHHQQLQSPVYIELVGLNKKGKHS
jgi:hypothetical protein